MKRPDAYLAAGAALVTIALTAVAFWLSYEHLHDVAHSNGLSDTARSWAWPATVDMFIVIGELLMLRASLRGRTDWWSISLAATGSLGSIALNVAGVGTNASGMEYVVAAVPPVAALLAFGALMRQVHEALGRLPATVPVPAARSAARATAPVPVPASDAAASPVKALPAAASGPSASPAPPVPAARPERQPEPATASDSDASRDLAEVAAAYRVLRATTGKHRPSAKQLGDALGLSRSRGQQLRDQLENHPDYAEEFAPALKSAG